MDFDLRPGEDPTRVAEEVETCDLHNLMSTRWLVLVWSDVGVEAVARRGPNMPMQSRLHDWY